MKLCGCKEACFKPGARWGHLENVMCEHMLERAQTERRNVTICALTDEVVVPYTTEQERVRLDDIISRQKIG